MGLVIENLTFAYGCIDALRGVSVRADAGRIAAVVGPSAAGKSTLLRCIIGALRPNHGIVFIDGKRVDDLSARRIAQRIAYVPQRSIVSAAFTVRQVIELGRYALLPDPRKVRQVIEQMDLEDVADRPYPELSVGQQQRVTFARALAQLGPNGYLILDEPVSAMDMKHSYDCMARLRELAEGGTTVIMALHDLSLAAAVADDAWVLDAGQVASAGPVGDVLTVERLRAVFGVSFEWVPAPWGASLLCSRPPSK